MEKMSRYVNELEYSSRNNAAFCSLLSDWIKEEFHILMSELKTHSSDCEHICTDKTKNK